MMEELNQNVIEAVVEVIRRANRSARSDRILREVLKQRHAWPAESRRVVAGAVFAYYRWQGWLVATDDLARQIRRAWELTQRNAVRPNNIPVEELRRRAIPDWIHQYMSVPDAWLAALQQEPLIWLRIRPDHDQAARAALGDDRLTRQDIFPHCCGYSGDEDLYRTPSFLAGLFEIQDLNSQVVGHLCQPCASQTWWDACAGEGGKTMLLADLMENRGLIWASDRADWRLARLRRRAARAGVFNYRAAQWDGSPRLPTKTTFDGVLVDAPCSGVGTWHRNPQARWTLTAGDVRELAGEQRQLLDHAARAVKPGGRLIYSVCTLTHKETRDVAAAFHEAHGDFQAMAVVDPLHPQLKPASQHWFWPQDHGGNGMFVALWIRKK
jgi:16S rRNA (cytosine967-C5)-methyltransferase